MTGRVPARGRQVLLAAMIAVWAAAVAEAETLRVRAGEHDGFSRIVVDLAGPSDWTLRRNPDGYVLRVARDGAEFDLSRVFHMIPRSRIADLVAGEDGKLGFVLGCDCNANAFLTAAGSIVVDIADGPPEPGSPFETPAAPSPRDEEPAADAGIAVPAGLPSWWQGQAASLRRGAPDDRRALLWRGAVSPDAGQEAAVSPADPAVPDPVQTDQKRSGQSGLPADPSHPTPAAKTLPGADQRPPEMPDSRVTKARDDLLEQLGRAASQGLVEVDRVWLAGREDGPAARADAEVPAPVGTGGPEAGIHSETSIDRDSIHVETRPSLTADDGACTDAEVLEVGRWGDGRPVPEQIAERRRPLVGEFDRPSPEAVRALARLYLYLGFGAETRAVLTAFAFDGEEAAILREVSFLVDGEAPDDAAALMDMAGCATPAALWGVLAAPALAPGADVDEGAVLRAFTALPPHLRRDLGPPLSERLIGIGRAAAAHAIRSAISRSAVDGGAALDMVEARLHLADGNVGEAEKILDPLALGNDPRSGDALVLTIETRLSRGETVAPALADAAGALAFERQDGPKGAILNRVHILGLGGSGQFAEAFAAFRRWPGEASADLRQATARQLFALLAAKADDAVFLPAYFANRDLLDPGAGPELRTDLASRLADAGFTGEVRAVLDGAAAGSDAGRMLLARAALGEYRPDEALGLIATLAGPEADALRAASHAMAGDHGAAARILAALGDADAAARAAWRGGDWAAAAGAGEAVGAAVRTLGLASDPVGAPGATGAEADAPGPQGELARGRALLDRSQGARATLRALLAEEESEG